MTNIESRQDKAKGNLTEQQRLMHLIFERVWIKNNEVASVCLRPNYHVTFYQSGSDGIRTRDLSLDRAACLAATPRPLEHF